VNGEVRRPGTLRLNAAMLRTALVVAGGPTVAAGSIIVINRAESGSGSLTAGGRETVEYGDVASGAIDLVLRDGDRVDLPRNAIGAVTYRVGPWHPPAAINPSSSTIGSLAWSQGLTIEQALDRMSIPAVLGAIDARVVRRTEDGFTFLAGPGLVLQPNDRILVLATTPHADVSGTWRVSLPDDDTAQLDLHRADSRVTGTLSTRGVTEALTGELVGDELLLLSTSATGKTSAFVADVVGSSMLSGTIDTVYLAADLPFVEQQRWTASRVSGAESRDTSFLK
jgi:hypothetical protein